MSSSDAAVVYDITVQQYLHAVAFMILYYDHALTFSLELKYIWPQRKSFAMWLFLINRYTAALGNVPVLVMDFINLPSESCNDYSYYRQALMVTNGLLVCALMTIRVYALFDCNRKLISILGVIFVSFTAVVIWALFGQGDSTTTIDQQFDLCCSCIAYPMKTSILLAVTWEAVFVYDLILLVLTVYISVRRWTPATDGGFSRRENQISLMRLLVRDGATYFSVMVLGNLANIMTFYFASPYLRGSLSVTVSNLSVVVMSRLVLNLCEWADTGLIVRTTTSPSSHMSSLAFGHPNLRRTTTTEAYELTRLDEVDRRD